MKKHKALTISLISIILFNIFFLIALFCYYDIITIPPIFLQSVTKEYWHMKASLTEAESNIFSITHVLHLLFSLTLIAEFFYIIFDDKYKNLAKKKNVINVIIVGAVVNASIFLFIKYRTEHYRLFMSFIPTEVLSMMLLSIVLKVRKYKL